MELVHKSLVEQLADALSERIQAEDLKPGDKLPSTAALVEDYGVSRPVVREALKILEGRGVIEMSGGRSATIRPVSGEVLTSFFQRALSFDQDRTRELMEVRYGIEAQSVRLAAERRSEEELTELQELVTRMREVIDDPEAYAELDVEFHLLIARATHNSLLLYLVSGIRDAFRDVMREGLRHRMSSGERKLVQIAHEQIVNKIAASDPDAASDAMTFHFDDAIRAIFE
ncbi:MAG: FadR family transcriptional regulator [Caldilineales bacterium]|nr:FadR family transcriptional regulator [Caldilineales bacterium]